MKLSVDMYEWSKLYILILSVFSAILLTACSSEPAYYSKTEIKFHVLETYGWGYKLVAENVYDDSAQYHSNGVEGIPCYEYVFQNKDGFEFSVITYARHVSSVTSGETSFYEKAITDNYVEQFCIFYKNDLESIISKYDFETEIDDGSINVSLEYGEQLSDFVGLYEEINKYIDGRLRLYLHVRVAPNIEDATGDYLNTFDYSLCTAKTKDEKQNSDELVQRLEKLFVSTVKEGYLNGNPLYEISDDLWYKYPAPYYCVSKVNGVDISELGEFRYEFEYDESRGVYITNYLDVCEDCEEYQFFYGDRGSFANLVQGLEGEYVCENMKAEWKIDKDVWNAELFLEEPDKREYKEFHLYKNGDEIELSDIGDRTSDSSYNRQFSISDVEKMLGVEAIIDEKAMTIEFVKTK